MILNKFSPADRAVSTTESSNAMRKMVTSYSVFLLMILGLFFYLYQTTLRNMCEQYNLQKHSTFTSNAEHLETDLRIMDIYGQQLLQNPSFRKIMNEQLVTPVFNELGNKLSEALATDIYAESLLPITETFCYFPGTDYVLNSSHFITHDRFYEWFKKYPENLHDKWIQYLTEEEYENRFLSLDEFTPNYSRSYYLYVINLNKLYYMEADVRVGFIFDRSELSRLFDCLEKNSTDFLFIFDSSGNTVLSAGNDSLTDAVAFSRLHTDVSLQFADYHTAGQRLTIGKYISADTGYTYYYSFPTLESTGELKAQRILFLMLFITALFTGIGLIRFFSKRNIRPIFTLGQELKNAVDAKEQLEEMVEHQRPLLCTSYVRQLMSGSVTSKAEAEYIRSFLELKSAACYNVLYIVVYNNFNTGQGNLSGIGDSAESPSDLIPAVLQKFFGEKLYYFSPAERTYALLLWCDFDEEKDFILNISNIVTRLHDYVLETCDIWLFAGIGRNTDSLMNLWEAYQQAAESISYTTKNYIFFPYEFVHKKSDAFYYPQEISTKLIHFVSSGNTAQVLELFNLIHQENIEERALPIHLLQFLLSDIRNTLLKARFTLPVGTEPKAVAQLDALFNEHLSFQLCEEIALTLCGLFTVEADDNSLIATIEKYISANYKDPSLGLNKISEKFQISESYFSHMFKEKTGGNFSTYLEQLRMREAARLIQETDISVNELYIAVGYNNANTFRRAFKKVYGITPSSMRESAGEFK